MDRRRTAPTFLPLAGLMILLAGVLCAAPVAAQDHPPPDGFLRLTGEFVRLEGFFEKGQWKEALAQVDRVEGLFGDMAMEIEKVVGIAGMDEMGFALEGMRQALKTKETRKAEEALSSLHNAYLFLADRFTFPAAPPSVALTQAALSEAMTALEAKEIPKVNLEMEELDWLLPWFEQDLQKKQVPLEELRAFHRKVTTARRASAAGDEAVLRPDLAEAQARAQRFFPLFSGSSTPTP